MSLLTYIPLCIAAILKLWYMCVCAGVCVRVCVCAVLQDLVTLRMASLDLCAVCYSACCSVVQYVAVCCSVLQCVAMAEVASLDIFLLFCVCVCVCVCSSAVV